MLLWSCPCRHKRSLPHFRSFETSHVHGCHLRFCVPLNMPVWTWLMSSWLRAGDRSLSCQLDKRCAIKIKKHSKRKSSRTMTCQANLVWKEKQKQSAMYLWLNFLMSMELRMCRKIDGICYETCIWRQNDRLAQASPCYGSWWVTKRIFTIHTIRILADFTT